MPLSTGEFKQRLADEFDSMVAPLVFDLSLAVDSSSLAPTKDGSQQGGWKIVNVYGSPDAAGGKPSDGNILKVIGCTVGVCMVCASTHALLHASCMHCRLHACTQVFI
jgi:hypothetical protein